MAQNNGKVIEWHDLPHSGFFYVDSTSYQKFLKTKNTGFVEPDNRKLTANAGLMDWTNGTDLISWKGLRRYGIQVSSDKFGCQIYKKNHEFDFTAQLSGALICGAAFKTKVFLVFALTSEKELRYFFIKDNVILASDSLGSYESLQQIVAVSADCTKAAFIAMPTGQDKKQTAVIDLIISFTDKTVTISSEITQDIDVFVDYAHIDHNIQSLPSTELDYLASYSRDTTRIICAVDFDRENTRKTFFIESSFSFSKAETQVYSNYVVAERNTIDYTIDKTSSFQAVINYNDFVTCSFDFSSANTVVKHWQGGILVEFADPSFYVDFGDYDPPQYDILTDTLNNSAEFLFIHFLDLRYDIFCYTKNTEIISGATSSYSTSIIRSYNLKIGIFESFFKDDLMTDTIPMYDLMFVDSTPQHNLNIPVQFNPYYFNLPVENNMLSYSNGIGIIDLYKNKIIKVQPISLDNNINSIFIKIDKNNVYYENSITELKGVV